ncbi:putative ankyrin repeat protein RF_0381 [Physella acuta]|uniref:putative ankyrin repeat protein RF_0381 n=1 Tax=Physella acuta TaxID=109671 RepID=UPI0027DC59AD|nr:putative ankyrin repeat protein RF_0381 [Physella acuta]
MSGSGIVQAVYKAAKTGNVEKFDIDTLDCRNRYGQSALMVSVEANHLLALKTLLSAGADPNLTRNKSKYITALTIAVEKNRVECVKELVRAGAFYSCERGLEALKMARDHNFLDAVVEGDIFMKNYIEDAEFDDTAFYVARENNCFDLLIALLSSGISIDLRLLTYEDIKGDNEFTEVFLRSPQINLNDELKNFQTLLMEAIRFEDETIIKILIEQNVDVNFQCFGETALDLACKTNKNTVKLLLDAGAKINDNTPFTEALEKQDREIMKLLIDAGCDINYTNTFYTSLGASISSEDVETTQFLLEHGADVTKVDRDGMTALMWAARTNNVNVIDLLLDFKAEVNCVDLQQTTALAHAVIWQNVPMVAKLIQAGADVNIASNYATILSSLFSRNNILEKILKQIKNISETNNTPLHLDASMFNRSKEIVNLLLGAGANVQSVDENGRTPLHMAAFKGHIIIVKSLCQYGADINAVDNSGNSPLFFSLLMEHKDISKYLLVCGADVNVICDSLTTPLLVAVLCDDTELVKLLIQHGALSDKGENSELLFALKLNNFEIAIALLENGADANKRVSQIAPTLLTAMHIASPYKVFNVTHLIPLSVSTSKKIEATDIKRLIKSFLNNGANISAADDEGNTCLHIAAEFCSADVLELFVAHKADVNVQNVKGETPLMMACRCGNVDAVRYLLSVEADVLLVNANKETALHYSIVTRHESIIITYLIENNVNKHARNCEGDTALHLAVKCCYENAVKSLVENGADVNEQNNKGNTPLFFVRDKKIIHYLKDDKTNINFQNVLGETALHRAYNDEIALALLEMGVDKEIRTNKGHTALMYAADARRLSLTQLLIKHGARINVQDNEGRNALMFAVAGANSFEQNFVYGYYSELNEVCEFLLECGADVNASDATGCTACMFADNEYTVENLRTLFAYGANLNAVDKENRSCLVHFLLKDVRWEIDEVLELGAEMLVDIKYRYLVENHADKYDKSVHPCSNKCFQFFLVNGIILNQPIYHLERYAKSRENLDFAKYLFAIGMIFKSDLQWLRKTKENYTVYPLTAASIIPPELQSAIYEPWPLVKLAFIEVSTLLGTGPMREEKLKQTKLPPRLQRTLMFQEPISRLPVEDWSKIPLCFDPVQYETLPCPRPLLYYWPVGHRLVI